MKTEKHHLISRPNIADEPKKIGEYSTYKKALRVGQERCGYGKFWIESKHQHAGRWTEFVPSELYED